MYKDKFIPNSNVEYKVKAQTFLKAEGTIVSLDVEKGRHDSAMEYTIQFRYLNDSLIVISTNKCNFG